MNRWNFDGLTIFNDISIRVLEFVKRMITDDNEEKKAAREQVAFLTQEIIKARYCYYELKFPIFTDNVYDNYMTKLAKFEAKYPCFAMGYSPLRHKGFVQHYAMVAFGMKKWPMIKRCLQWISLNKEQLTD